MDKWIGQVKWIYSKVFTDFNTEMSVVNSVKFWNFIKILDWLIKTDHYQRIKRMA